MLVLGTQWDPVFSVAETILDAGGRVAVGVVHNSYNGDVEDDNLAPVGPMFFAYEGRFAYLGIVRGEPLYDLWTERDGPKQILAEADRLLGRPITDALAGALPLAGGVGHVRGTSPR